MLKKLITTLIIIQFILIVKCSKTNQLTYSELPPSVILKYKSKCIDMNSLKFTSIPLHMVFSDTMGTDIIDILSRDKLIKNRISSLPISLNQYFTVDTSLLLILKDFYQFAEEENIEYCITSFLRNCLYNKRVGGSSCSMHQFGKAVDIKIISDDKDKCLKYFYSDSRVGGIGLYKKYKNIIHIDVRGYRTAWTH